MEEVVVLANAVPPALLTRVEGEVASLEASPNYWFPAECMSTPATVAEQAVAHLYDTHIKGQHVAQGKLAGAEYWVQVFEKGRGLGFHMDKDEHLMATEGRLVTPFKSSVLYLTGDAAGPGRQSPTVIIDQRFDASVGAVTPPVPAWSTLSFPCKGNYCIFDGTLGHGVLDSGEEATPRVTMLVNWWGHRPLAIGRDPAAAAADKEDPPAVAAGSGAAEEGAGTLGNQGADEENAAQLGMESLSLAGTAVAIRIVTVEAGKLTHEDDMILVEEALEEAGIRLQGADAAHAVRLVHPGLTLCPVQGGDELVVGAAFLLTQEEESSSGSSSEEE